MTINYEIKDNGISQIIMYEKDGILYSFPADSGNSDYQRYLRWLEDPTAEEGGTLS